MRKILFRYSCVFFFLFGGFAVFPQGGGATNPPPGHPDYVPPPDGQDCCAYLEGDDPEGNPSVEYLACLADPAAHCPVPIDNSRYIYISMVAAVALASFVIARRMKT